MIFDLKVGATHSFELIERLNTIREVLLYVLVEQEIAFYEIHDSLTIRNPDDNETLLSHLDQLYDFISS